MEKCKVCIVFADLSGFTAMTEAHGDIDAVNIALRFKNLAELSLLQDAKIVKTIGDAVMIVAPNSVVAANIVLKIFKLVQEEVNFPQVRIGMHEGEAICSDNDYFGAAVNLAARVADYARAGQILCTLECANRIRTDLKVDIQEIGLGHFKNISEPVVLFELHTTSLECFTNVDPVCHMQVANISSASRILHNGVVYYFCNEQCVKKFLDSPIKYEANEKSKRE